MAPRANTRVFELLAIGTALSCGTDRDDGGASGSASLDGITATGGDGITVSDGDGDDDDDDDGGPVLDVSGSDLGPGGGGDCPGGGGMMGDDVEFSYIWIANSPEGTVSKIDTRAGVELARYATGPATQSEPSRTSVNLYGDVAVSNRGSQAGGQGGVTKIIAREEECPDTNGNGMVDTSTGPGNVLPWGTDECVAWNLPIPSDIYQHGPRPTAWEGTQQGGCAAPSPRLWMGWYDFNANTGVFHRVDGATGTIQDTVMVPGLSGLNYGPYGGAVNKEGDFWVSCWQVGPLIHIDGDTLDAQVIPMPAPPADQQWAYGMSLDQYGNPWIASAGAAAVYDVANGQWQFVSTGNISTRGVMVDKEDRAWFAVDDPGACGLAVVDVQSRTLLQGKVPLNGCAVPVGVSIDVDGFVWVVDQGNSLGPAPGWAFKVDPDTYQIALQVPGLFGPYTYSDMTGAGLNLVVNPPAG